jgi:demethylmenaquinone methyltransferase/2-methoxy-6-polyprenyl-1,4-benzoquinol methylase
MADFSRVNRPVQEAGVFYTRLAPWYDLLASSEKRYIRRGLELLDPNPDEWILEIGFGTGYAQEWIISKLENGFSAAVDLSKGMAVQTQEKLEQANVLDRSGLAISDSLPLPFSSNSFNRIFSSFTLELFDTPLIPILLGECRRVLKPEGRLVLVCLSKDQPLGIMGRLYEAFHDRFPGLADCRPIPLYRLLIENGLKVITSEHGRIWGLPVTLVVSRTKNSLK